MKRGQMLVAGVVVAIAVVGAVQTVRMDGLSGRFESAADWLGRCGRIGLTMTREEVVFIMGAPSKELREADGRAVLEFAHPEFPSPPRIWLDGRRGRVDAVFCNSKSVRQMTPAQWAEVDAYEAYQRRLADAETAAP